MKTITNHHWHEFKLRDEVPPKVLADEFDWTNDDHEAHGDYSDGFLCYRGAWYHLGDFMRGGAIAPWQGYASNGFSYAVAIRLSDDGELYQIATLLS